MRVGFLNNQIDNRGTGNALYDYAHYNETILGNESFILSPHTSPPNRSMLLKLYNRFGKVYNIAEYGFPDLKLDAVYHIKYGYDTGFRPPRDIRYCVHSVFDISQPHGDRYASISRWLSGDSSGIPYVPHIVNLPDPPKDMNFRKMWNIPETAVVFGRYGGRDTFDIPWVWDVMEKILKEYNNTWFVFANTEPAISHPHMIYYEEMFSDMQKAAFVKASDYMLHARHRGETFGISVGEFASKGKPIITYGQSGEKAHLDMLPFPYVYNSEHDLYPLLSGLSHERVRTVAYGYTMFTPQAVMKKFEEVFLS